MPFHKPILNGLSLLTGGVFALGIPTPMLSGLFETGPAFHILTATTKLYDTQDPNSTVRGILKEGSCVRWIGRAHDRARIRAQTNTKIKEVWVDAALLVPAPLGRGPDNCKATFIPRADGRSLAP